MGGIYYEKENDECSTGSRRYVSYGCFWRIC